MGSHRRSLWPASDLRKQVIDCRAGEAESCESTEAKEDMEEVSEGFEHNLDNENPQVINQEEDEAAKEQQMNGESGWRALGGRRRCRLRSGGSLFEQSGQGAFSSFQKGSIPSGGSRHKQTRRRNHHHHQQGRGRRRTGRQLFLAFREMLSESLSVWCISCVHMLIEIIVTLTHNCGVAVESGVLKLHNCGKRILVQITDLRGMRADVGRILKWMRCTAGHLVEKTVRTEVVGGGRLVLFQTFLCFSCFKLPVGKGDAAACRWLEG